MKRIAITVLLFIIQFAVFAQDITGTWKTGHSEDGASFTETTAFLPDGTAKSCVSFSMTLSAPSKDGTSSTLDFKYYIQYNSSYKCAEGVLEMRICAESIEVETSMPEGFPAGPFNMIKNSTVKEIKKEAKKPQVYKVVSVSPTELVLLDTSDPKASPDKYSRVE